MTNHWQIKRAPDGQLTEASCKLVQRQITNGVGTAKPDVFGRRRRDPTRGGLAGGPCSRCGDDVQWLPEALIGEPEGLCKSCARYLQDRRLAEAAKLGAPRSPSHAELQERVQRHGLAGQARILSALEITTGNVEGQLRTDYKRGLRAAAAVHRFLRQSRGLLVLSGMSGAGKSTAAAWAAWKTKGVFYPRSRWSTMVDHGEVPHDVMRMFLAASGVVVLDDTMQITGAGEPKDTRGQLELVFRVAAERHEAELPTILTTQALEDDLSRAYGREGEALLRRAHQGHDGAGAPSTGGFVACTDQVEARL